MSNTSLYGSAITEVVPISDNTSPYSTTAIGVVSDTNTTSLYSNNTNFTTGLVTSAVTSVNGSGAGISVNPTTGNVVVVNTGVTSLIAGSGIAVSAATGAVTITNTGIGTTYNIDASTVSGGANLNLTGSDASTDSVKFASGTGITVSRTDANTITIANTAAPGGVTSITGTANQIIASSSTGAVTLSTPQDIATTSSPTFANMTLTGDIAVNGGDITTTAATFNLVNATATTLNIGAAATAIGIGASTGTITINNPNLVMPVATANMQLAGRSRLITARLNTTTTTANQVFVSQQAISYHNIKFQVSVVSGANYHSADITLTQNGTTSYITVSNEMWTNVSLTDWSTDISGSSIRLLVTPTNAVTTYTCLNTGVL